MKGWFFWTSGVCEGFLPNPMQKSIEIFNFSTAALIRILELMVSSPGPGTGTVAS